MHGWSPSFESLTHKMKVSWYMSMVCCVNPQHVSTNGFLVCEIGSTENFSLWLGGTSYCIIVNFLMAQVVVGGSRAAEIKLLLVERQPTVLLAPAKFIRTTRCINFVAVLE